MKATAVQCTLYIDNLGAPPEPVFQKKLSFTIQATDDDDGDQYHLAWASLVADDDVCDSVFLLWITPDTCLTHPKETWLRQMLRK